MPGQKLHEKIDTIVFGKAYPEVHAAKDAPWEVLGPLHRIVFHDPLYSLLSGHPAVSTVHDIVDVATLPLAPLVALVEPRLVRE